MTMLDILDRSPVIPVIVIDRIEDALPLAETLVEAGLDVLEVTLRSPMALDSALAMKAAFPEASIGVGTVMTPAMLEQVATSGLDFGVSPGTSPALLESLPSTKLPFLPGVATVSEAMALQEAGATALKFFPAEASGGVPFLKSIRSVLPDLAFCPTGGISAENAASYLAIDTVRAVGGSWIAPPDLIHDGNWPEIARRATATLRSVSHPA
jgi:2-dehydro-3-deoxyphosphogluconate aldolase/(4S)-4-hydroxy-2-oxoglutarate aldolase